VNASVSQQPPEEHRTLAGNHRRALIGKTISHIILIVGGFSMLMPFFWLITSSLKQPETIFAFPPQWFPKPAHWSNYVELFDVVPVMQYAKNTLIITLGATAGQVITSAIVAYGFARLRFAGRDKAFAVILSTLMLPYAVTIVPLYVMFSKLHWINTYWPLILPYWFGGGAFNIFLLRQFFRSIPMDLDEAAILDGAGRLRIFWNIILPLSKPAIVAVTILSLLHHWNDFLGPVIYLTDSSKWTLAIGISSLQGIESGIDWTHYQMVLSTMIVVPVIIIFFLAQRVFIQGITVTGLKG
jgi:ABC-type glycerol-3-phosphate transport system permease component